MEPSPQQSTALGLVQKFLHSQDPVFYLAGYAGTGKTTLAKEIAEQSDLDVMFAAYTGKAAYVLRQKGCVDARTIHSLIYKPAGESKSDTLRKIEQELIDLKFDPPKDEQIARDRKALLEKRRDDLLMHERRKPMFTLNPDSDLHDIDLLIVDEVSMVDEAMGLDLMSFRKKIIVLGDPMQLPPVGSGGYFTKRTPNITLTEIHRHARESGILRLATDIRLTGEFNRSAGYYGDDCNVSHRSKLHSLQKIVLEADQILVGKNATRHSHNARYRELTHREGATPIGGDKVVCLKNNHKQGLLNGSLWRVHESVVDEDTMTVELSISSEEDGGNGVTVNAWTHHFLGKEEELNLKKWNRGDSNEFDYGYALTVHKAQGSQWNDVVLWDESYVFRNDRTRWLYTGVTRAAKRLTVVL